MGFILMAGGAFRVGFTQLVSQLEQSEREILKLCLSLGAKPEIVGKRWAIEKPATIELTAEGDQANLQNEMFQVQGSSECRIGKSRKIFMQLNSRF